MLRKIILNFVIIVFFGGNEIVFCQNDVQRKTDSLQKVEYYNQYKLKVLNFTLKEFDALFFEFFTKKADPSLLLTKEEFYQYTVQLAIFSDRLVALYPTQKEIAAENKKKWLAESYENYLLGKKNAKK